MALPVDSRESTRILKFAVMEIMLTLKSATLMGPSSPDGVHLVKEVGLFPDFTSGEGLTDLSLSKLRSNPETSRVEIPLEEAAEWVVKYLFSW